MIVIFVVCWYVCVCQSQKMLQRKCKYIFKQNVSYSVGSTKIIYLSLLTCATSGGGSVAFFSICFILFYFILFLHVNTYVYIFSSEDASVTQKLFRESGEHI